MFNFDKRQTFGGMKFLIVISFFLFFILSSSLASAWWDYSWQARQPIYLNQSSGVNFTNYQVRLNITYDADMRANFSDIRFVNSTDNGELKYWVQEKVNSNYAYVWVLTNLTNGTNTTIYMYYKNSGCADYSESSTSLSWNPTTRTMSNTKMNVAFFDNYNQKNITFNDAGTYVTMGGSGYNNPGSVGADQVHSIYNSNTTPINSTAFKRHIVNWDIHHNTGGLMTMGNINLIGDLTNDTKRKKNQNMVPNKKGNCKERDSGYSR
jgi:hypothetical protein